MADTREVARMLAEAMSAGEQPGQRPFSTPFVPPQTEAMASMAVVGPLAGVGTPVRGHPGVVAISDAGPEAAAGTAAVDPTLPPRYAGFYQLLISRQEWDVKDIDRLARQQGLMLSGAIEALNEWAAEKRGGQLFVEDGPKLYVEQAYLS
jgi:hypothetical protein